MIGESTILLLVLMAAVMHATWNALVKAGGDRLVMQSLVIGVPSFVGAVALFFLPPMALAAWPWLALSTVIHFAYYWALLSAYRHGDLSQVYPIARGLAPVGVAVIAWLYADESLTTGETFGVAVVSLGIMSLAWRRRGALHGSGEAVLWALLTGLTIIGYTVADGFGVRASGAAYTYIAWLFAVEGLPLFLFVFWRRRGQIWGSYKPRMLRGIFGGLVAGAAYGIVIWAMSQTQMAGVIALRETSVLIAALIGTTLLREPFGRRRVVSAALIASGAILLHV